MIRPSRTTLLIVMALYGLVLAAITCVNLLGAERWWLGALNLYLPQAFWAVPAVLLLAAAASSGWRWMLVPALCLAWVCGPIMGLRWSMRTPPPPAAGPAIRILTCNVKYGRRDTRKLLKEITRYQPQIVLFQDAPGFLQGPLGSFFKGWQVRGAGQFVIASRLPLSAAELRCLDSPTGRHIFYRCQVQIGATAVTLYDVHFQSPRDSLNAFRTDPVGTLNLPDAIGDLEHNAAQRLDQARGLRGLVQAEPGPVIIAGDLNSTDPSRVCATLREAGLQDAFSAGGRGYGYTYGHFLLERRIPWLHLSWMRIDHIMMSPRLRTWRCWVGTSEASDHRPVLADVYLAP